MGDYELMRVAFLMDLGCIIWGLLPAFQTRRQALTEPVFCTKPSIPFFYLIRGYNRRLVKMAQARRLRGLHGRQNHCRRLLTPGYTFSIRSAGPIARALLCWTVLEVTEGWRTCSNLCLNPGLRLRLQFRPKTQPAHPVVEPRALTERTYSTNDRFLLHCAARVCGEAARSSSSRTSSSVVWRKLAVPGPDCVECSGVSPQIISQPHCELIARIARTDGNCDGNRHRDLLPQRAYGGAHA
jgi:hypothetical protein